MADTTFVQGVSQQTSNADLLMRDVSTVLSTFEPDLVPLDTLLRRMPQGGAAIQDKIEWASVGMWPRRDTVTATAAEGASGALVDVYVSNPTNWRVMDTLISPNNLSFPMLRVEAIGADYISLRAVEEITAANTTGRGVVPQIDEGTVLSWIGNALPEGGGPSVSRAVMPSTEYNFCELHDVIIDVTGTRKATKNYTNIHDWTRAQKEQLREFRLNREYKSIFGKISKSIDATTGKPVWTMNGVTRYIEKTLTYNKNALGIKLTESQVMDWLVEVFSGNNGSQTRFLFADSYLAGEINKVPLTSLRSRGVVNVLGLKCERLEFNFGVVLMKHHRGLNELGFDNYGLILDMEQIRYRNLQPMEKNVLQLRTQGTNMDAEQYLEQASVEMRYPACHAIIQGVAA